MSEVTIRLDRSRPYGSCHGERMPDDPHYHVHFWQGGMMGGHRVLLPFDAHGNLVPDDGQRGKKQGLNADAKPIEYGPLYDDNMRKYLAAKKIKMQALTAIPSQTAIVEDGDKTEDDVLTPGDDEVNLEAWLRGEANYLSGKVRDAYAKRFHKRTNELREIFIDLVLDEQIIPEDQVAKGLAAKYMPPKIAQGSVPSVIAA
jgi:hypothetical protein